MRWNPVQTYPRSSSDEVFASVGHENFEFVMADVLLH